MGIITQEKFLEYIVIIFLVLAIYLYCLLGGADFGAGVLEFFVNKRSRPKYEQLLVKTLGPVWEANHMWLIIIVVILLNGFPKAYANISIYFHIPLSLMLIGVILRGCAFTFRHYDAVIDNTRRYYSAVFSLACVLTPVMSGVIIGGLMLGKVDTQAIGYYAKYIAPWFNLFSFSIGFFVLCIFSFLSSVFLIGETDDKDLKSYLIKKVFQSNILTVIFGGLIFVFAEWEGLTVRQHFLSNPVSLISMIFGALSLIVLWTSLKTGHVWRSRLIAGFQLGMILSAWFVVIFPNIVFFKDGKHLTLFNSAAPSVTMNILAWTLIIGAGLFIPALCYLFFVFKIKRHF